jgi:hypothetical protein
MISRFGVASRMLRREGREAEARSVFSDCRRSKSSTGWPRKLEDVISVGDDDLVDSAIEV